MKKLIELMLEDLSTRDVFLFQISCGTCGKAYANKPTRFSKAGIVPTTREKKILYDAIYEQERNTVRRGVIRDAAEHINYCPICKRLVCNRCFLICEDLDMCQKCAAQLQEPGVPVLSDVLEAAI